MGIYLHKDYGLNPVLMKCYWCGKDSGIALPGAKLRKKAPNHPVVVNKEPCQDCINLCEQGLITLVVIKDGEAGNRKEQGEDYEPYRTGKILHMSKDTADRMFGEHPSYFRFIEEGMAVQIEALFRKQGKYKEAETNKEIIKTYKEEKKDV